MNTTGTTHKPATVRFSAKGRVVIPLPLRKAFDIEGGTRAVIETTPEGLLLKPITAVSIGRTRGILKRKPRQKPLATNWADHKRKELALENEKAGLRGK